MNQKSKLTQVLTAAVVAAAAKDDKDLKTKLEDVDKEIAKMDDTEVASLFKNNNGGVSFEDVAAGVFSLLKAGRALIEMFEKMRRL